MGEGRLQLVFCCNAREETEVLVLAKQIKVENVFLQCTWLTGRHGLCSNHIVSSFLTCLQFSPVFWQHELRKDGLSSLASTMNPWARL